MKKIIYLIGAGATQAEMDHAGVEADTTMAGISENVLEMSRNNSGPYSKLIEKLGTTTQQDIELMISLCEGSCDPASRQFSEVSDELRKLFRKYLISQISNIKTPRLLTTLLHLHSKYAKFMGKDGEEILGILTTNYDTLLEEACFSINGGINAGVKFHSVDYKPQPAVPPILKLHGSFNWNIQRNSLQISREVTLDEGEFSGWVPPSVFKKPVGIFQRIWNQASNLLVECDTLRVIGSSLRNEDWSLIALVFTSQVIKRTPTFDIELIVKEKSANDEELNRGILQRLPFLAKAKPPSLMEIFSDGWNDANIFLDWLNNKVTEIHSKTETVDDDILIKNAIGWT